jgi:hypothetical protein
MHADLMKAGTILFWAALVCTTSLQAQIEDFGKTDFTKADSIARLYPHHSLQDLRILSDKLTKSLPTAEEKFRAIYKWVCINIENDYALYKQNKQKRETLKDPEALKKWDKKIGKVVFETLLKKHSTVCTGYAYVVRELAYHAGLPCKIIHGYGRTVEANIGGPGIPNHSWNAIQLYNKWYLCDATWSSGAIDPEKAMFVTKYNDAYFLADPSLFVRNHYPLDSAWMLLDHKPTLTAFLNRPLIYSILFQYKIDQLIPETFNITASKGETVSFQFSRDMEHPFEKVELNIKGKSYHHQSYLTSNGLYAVDHRFAWKGTYVVHILLDSNYAFTYTVKVR